MWFANETDWIASTVSSSPTTDIRCQKNGGNSYINIVTICRHQDNNQIWVPVMEKLYLFDSRRRNSPYSMYTDGRRRQSTVSSEWHIRQWRAVMDRNNQRTVCLQREKRYVEALSTFSFRSPFIAGQSRVGDLQRLVRDYLDRVPGMGWRNTTNARTTSQGIYPRALLSDVLPATRLSLWWKVRREYCGRVHGTGLARFNKETGQFRYYFGEGDTLTIPRIRTLFQRTANSLSRLRRRTLYIQHHDRRMFAYRRLTK